MGCGIKVYEEIILSLEANFIAHSMNDTNSHQSNNLLVREVENDLKNFNPILVSTTVD